MYGGKGDLTANLPIVNVQIRNHSAMVDGSKTIVYEVPVRQEGVQLFIANDGPLQSKR